MPQNRLSLTAGIAKRMDSTDQTKRDTLQRVFDLMTQWLEKAKDPDTPVINYRQPSDLAEDLALNPTFSGAGELGLLRDVENYLENAVKTSNPAYLNQLFGGFNHPGFVGELITALTNTSMYTYEVAPAATLIERAMVDKMLSYTGWEDGSGVFTTGGSNSNLLAMMLARNNAFPQTKMHGLPAGVRPVVFASERSHFSMLKSANIIGIGQEAVVGVDLDENGQMRGPALEKAIKRAMEDGKTPFMICSTAGTTETGAFDAIDEVADIAEKYGLHHHVDGSWGGGLILTEGRNNRFRGLERADTFAWNPHKLMNVPVVCAVLLVKDAQLMDRHIRTMDADYIYHDNENSQLDFGPASLQCGRRVDALKLWLAWKYYGDDGYAARMDKVLELASYATQYVEENDRLELLFPTQSLNVNFRFRTPDGIDVNLFNRDLRYRLIRTGQAMVNYCHLERGLSIRLVLLNPDLEHSDLDRFFERFIACGKEMLSEIEAASTSR